MSHPAARQGAMHAATQRKAIEPDFDYRTSHTQDIFGEDVFGISVMREKLSKAVFRTLARTIKRGESLDPAVADAVATAMKDWAIARGASHYAHVFYPLTGLSAEKHDSFVIPTEDGRALTEFSGKQLIQGEPDASSFPSGGLRATFEARGYTAWDVTSPAFLLAGAGGATLCIPTAFLAWTGEALDKKTPVLRSMQALNLHARRVLKLFGHDEPGYLIATAGPEQEYFLIDKSFLAARPDLQICGRTLFGARPPKGQEFEDQYFGAIPARVLACMQEVERALFRLGVPVKTRHNEVAPGQYEFAPVYENGNVAADHQQLVMLTLKRVADRHGLACLLHEKPFAGINGSGKHLNWSLGNDVVGNLLEPGETPHENAQFLVFCAAVIRAVHRHAALLRCAVAHSGNDHRLGANEAPPAIISIFLGELLTGVFDQLEGGGYEGSTRSSFMTVGVDTLPPLPKDAGDRNRTSPFAFTGNKFEFRAVGSSQSIAGPLFVLNTIVAESLDEIATELERVGTADRTAFNAAVQALVRRIYAEHKAVVFNGDNYSAEWHAEAERRGLPNRRDTVEALRELVEPRTVQLFDRYRVLNPREVHSRFEIFVERYCKDLNSEARLCLNIARVSILPAAYRWQRELAQTVAAVQAVTTHRNRKALDRMCELTDRLEEATESLEKAIPAGGEGGDLVERARHFRDVVAPAMKRVREAADVLEDVVAADLWPLSSYREMLFTR